MPILEFLSQSSRHNSILTNLAQFPIHLPSILNNNAILYSSVFLSTLSQFIPTAFSERTSEVEELAGLHFWYLLCFTLRCSLLSFWRLLSSSLFLQLASRFFFLPIPSRESEPRNNKQVEMEIGRWEDNLWEPGLCMPYPFFLPVLIPEVCTLLAVETYLSGRWMSVLGCTRTAADLISLNCEAISGFIFWLLVLFFAERNGFYSIVILVFRSMMIRNYLQRAVSYHHCLSATISHFRVLSQHGQWVKISAGVGIDLSNVSDISS